MKPACGVGALPRLAGATGSLQFSAVAVGDELAAGRELCVAAGWLPQAVSRTPTATDAKPNFVMYAIHPLQPWEYTFGYGD